MNEDSAKLAGAFLLGGLIGATIALLYAPKSGQQTRRDIAKTSRRLNGRRRRSRGRHARTGERFR
ncbi:MAG: YtxH domain-containing protein [Bacillus subtilis]|nr:YtxH domain-containing protein [Bacillus subtilis]